MHSDMQDSSPPEASALRLYHKMQLELSIVLLAKTFNTFIDHCLPPRVAKVK